VEEPPVAPVTPETLVEELPPAPEEVSEGIAASTVPPPEIEEVEKPPKKPARVSRPTPVATGLKPVASATPGPPGPPAPTPRSTGPRPVASAAPGDVAEERRRDRKKRGKKGRRTEVDRAAVEANISRTLASIRGAGPKKTTRRREEGPTFREREELRRAEEREREKTLVRVNEFITVSELAETLKVNSTDIVTFCFKELGMMVTVNQRLDFDQIELIASEFGFEAHQEEEYVPEAEVVEEVEKEENLEPRPPVVTVMGHVDHGKTSLLDHIRKTNVIAGEAGGITQHIGAYHVELPNKKGLSFLDTPGHEAFTAMRARGAQVTDLVVLVVAADDQVMPQTVEAISHAKNAGVPMVVAINKIDLPTANSEKVKQDLLQHEVVLEDFGGDTMCSAISAKTGEGVEDLLDKVLLQAELLDKKANPNRRARGTVIESSLDPGKGPMATVLVQAGTLVPQDDFICGTMAGRVRAMFDERGKRVDEAGPSIPVQVLGFEGVPQAGDSFAVAENPLEARDIAQKRQRLDREAAHRRTSRAVSLEDLSRQLEEGRAESLRIIIKADQAGPAEALADSFASLSTDEVKVEVIHRGVGAITEGDVVFAKASRAIVIGFHVRPDANARAAAERERVDVRTYRVIYEAVEDVKAGLEGLLAPEEREVVLGEAEVLQLFKISGIGTICGCLVRGGIVRRGSRVRVLREGVEIYSGTVSSLKRFKEDVREVKDGLECGIGVENFNDIKVGDILEVFSVEQIARTLESMGAAKDG
jgi:translation initiation factor IF-2